MMSGVQVIRCGGAILLVLCLLSMAVSAADAMPPPEALLHRLDTYPHSRRIAVSEAPVLDYEVGLGAIQKIRGSWQFKRSERHSGELLRYTWQITDGFTAADVMEELVVAISQQPGATELFACDGRACGRGAQWANQVFGQRLLYGREDQQRYRVYALVQERDYRMLIYAAVRTADRQYLHVELLEIAPGSATSARQTAQDGDTQSDQGDSAAERAEPAVATETPDQNEASSPGD